MLALCQTDAVPMLTLCYDVRNARVQRPMDAFKQLDGFMQVRLGLFVPALPATHIVEAQPRQFEQRFHLFTIFVRRNTPGD